jgi:hypothetical protein
MSRGVSEETPELRSFSTDLLCEAIWKFWMIRFLKRLRVCHTFANSINATYLYPHKMNYFLGIAIHDRTGKGEGGRGQGNALFSCAREAERNMGIKPRRFRMLRLGRSASSVTVFPLLPTPKAPLPPQ